MKMKKRGDRKGCSAFLHVTLMSLFIVSQLFFNFFLIIPKLCLSLRSINNLI